jgi:hypothetical protein
MRKIFLLIECVALACCVATAQTARMSRTSPPTAATQSDRVSDDLAVLNSHLEKTAYKRGDPIRVAIVLTAGPKGAYFPPISAISTEPVHMDSPPQY